LAAAAAMERNGRGQHLGVAALSCDGLNIHDFIKTPQAVGIVVDNDNIHSAPPSIAPM
jgi:hypothetical protein